MNNDEDERPSKKLKTGRASATVSTFFTKISQKPKSALNWQIRHETLLVGRYKDNELFSKPDTLKLKIAAFDLDGTLISTKSGNRFAKDESDWKFFHISTPRKIQELYANGYQIVIVSNQAGLKLKESAKRYTQFKAKIEALVSSLAVPLLLYAATGHDIYRKPRPGTFTELCKDLSELKNDQQMQLDMDQCFFVGDAAGRSLITGKGKSTDHSASDRKWAMNVNFKFYTPEEFFHSVSPQKYALDGFDPQTFSNPEIAGYLFKRMSKQEIVLFVGSPASGKSSYFYAFLDCLKYVRINQDTLKTRQKCLALAKEALLVGKSICVDNTNANIETRRHWLSLAKEVGNIPVRVVQFTADVKLCQHNNAVRAFQPRTAEEKRELLPTIAFTSWTSRFEVPTLKEGFSDISTVDFLFSGNQDELEVWKKYWV